MTAKEARQRLVQGEPRSSAIHIAKRFTIGLCGLLRSLWRGLLRAIQVTGLLRHTRYNPRPHIDTQR